MRLRRHTDNAAAQERMRDLEELRRHQEDSDMRAVLETAAGRRFFWRVVAQEAGTARPAFAGDAPHTFFNEGRRAVGIALVRDAQRVAPEAYMQALTEALAAAADERLHRQDAEAAATMEAEE